MSWMRIAVVGMVAMGWVGALGSSSYKTTTLKELRDLRRVLLIFAPSTGEAKLKAQESELRAHDQEFKERDLIAIEVTEHEATGSGIRLEAADLLRKRFDVGVQEFVVVLIGKDGGEKLRSHSPLQGERLVSTIDAMPMRQDEMRRKQ